MLPCRGVRAAVRRASATGRSRRVSDTTVSATRPARAPHPHRRGALPRCLAFVDVTRGAPAADIPATRPGAAERAPGPVTGRTAAPTPVIRAVPGTRPAADRDPAPAAP